MKEKICIIQTGRLGDTIIALPIAKYYYDRGYSIDWAIHENHKGVFDYVDYINELIVIPKEIDMMFSVYEAYKLVDGTKYRYVIDLSIGFPGSLVGKYTDTSFLETFVHVKYHLAGIDVSEKWNLKFNRNEDKEKELYQKLVERDYILIHNSSDDGTAIFDVDSEYQKIYFGRIEGYEIFDWYQIILNAKEVYCIDSSLCNFIDVVSEFSHVDKFFCPMRTNGWFKPPLKNFAEYMPKYNSKKEDRIAFTIIFNGKHHLEHNDYYKTMLDNFDHWVVVEGASKSIGSTSWCKTIGEKYHKNGSSNDGTIELLEKIAEENPKLTFVKSNGFWNGKDEQVNVAMQEVKKITNSCFLWEVDIDEQWSLPEIEKAEKELVEKGGKTGLFKCEYYVGDDLIVRGEWGEGPYNRLWRWSGENFSTHEPPVLEGGNGKEVLLESRFNHYSYYFQKDVEFKNDWYSGHEDILPNWLNLKNETEFPIHVSKLVTGPWGKTNAFIYKKK